MMKLLHDIYNMDTNSVELTYRDGSVLAVDCEEVENFCTVTSSQMADLDWLIYHARWRVLGWQCLEKWSVAGRVLRCTEWKNDLAKADIS